MTNLTIQLPDALARRLEVIAANQHKSIQQLALEHLSSLMAVPSNHPAGSPAALLRAMQEPPHLTAADVAELDAAILSGRLPVGSGNLF